MCVTCILEMIDFYLSVRGQSIGRSRFFAVQVLVQVHLSECELVLVQVQISQKWTRSRSSSNFFTIRSFFRSCKKSSFFRGFSLAFLQISNVLKNGLCYVAIYPKANMADIFFKDSDFTKLIQGWCKV